MIKLQNVSKQFQLGDKSFTALNNINLQIKKGEFTAIVGPSGSGKSTLMYLIGLLDRPTSGQILLDHKNTAHLSDDQLSQLRNQFVGFVFQQFNLINKLTVWENILLPTIYQQGRLSFSPPQRAAMLMKRFAIADKADSYPNKISGGQQQRVAIARALINQPKLILADEPTGNLDTKTGSRILDLLAELNQQDKLTVVVVTHESHVARRVKRKISLKDGKIISKLKRQN